MVVLLTAMRGKTWGARGGVAVDWRREDTGYAVAAAAALAFLIYLLAANFGLVPSPLAPLQASRSNVTIQSPALVDIPLIPKAAATVRTAVGHAIKPVTQHVIGDTTAPIVSILTKTGTQVSLAEPGLVQGVATDAGSGLDKVVVAFVNGSQKTLVAASTTCGSGATKQCTWTAPVPGAIGGYSIVAQAVDKAGNIKQSAPIDLTVVNTGSTVKQVTDVVGRVPTVLDKTVGGVVNTVGALLGGLAKR